jgi:hypothetical protein
MDGFYILNAVFIWGFLIFNLILTISLAKRVQGLKSETNVGSSMLQAGDLAPDFQEELLDGAPMTLFNLPQNGLTMLFLSQHCQPCRNYLSRIAKINTPSYKKNLLIVSLGTKEDATQMKDEFGLDELPILVTDYGTEFITKYKVVATPTYYHVNQDKVIEYGGVVDADLDMLMEKWEKPLALA